MNWIQKKLQSFVEKAKITFKRQRPSKGDQEKSLWINCPDCNQMQFKEDLNKNFSICKCSYHFDLDPKIRFEKLIFDEGQYELIPCPTWADPDPLNFSYNGIKAIDKYKNNQKKTGQESAILIATGKMNGLNIVCAGYNWSFGGAAISLRESEHLLASMQYAIDNKVDCFLSFYCSGGMDVKGSMFSLTKGMAAIIMAMNTLKRKNILTVGVLCSKSTGGLFVDTFANSLIFGESKKSKNLLFSGTRVSAAVNKGTELPEDFGYASSLTEKGQLDGYFENRLEIKNKISTLIRVLLKKPEKEARIEKESNVKVDSSIKTSA
tara:strand:+ start:1993 stop:2955 length:963 start_codon:yes stop_codon:yes gene_type:complete